jgi:acetylornithine deacetylase/succinyl-diaminopimelate desuccinylase-like protein
MISFEGMRRTVCALLCSVAALAATDDNRSLGDRTRQYLSDLVRIDTSNPPGNETQLAQYLKQAVEAFGIRGELVGNDPKRMNFIGRLPGDGKARPLLLMAHSDVFPVDRAQWTVNPFGAELRNGYIYGRGTQEAKNFLAAEMAVMVEIKRRNLKLSRDLILLSEADEEAGSSGVQWLIQNAWPKIDAEAALSEGGAIVETKDGTRLFQVETLEKVPTRILLTARGAASRGTVPRPDMAILRLNDAISRLTRANNDQPLRYNGTTRRYFRRLAAISDYEWLAPLLPRLDNATTMQAAAAQIRMHDPDLDAMLHTIITTTVVKGNNNLAEAQVEVWRMPSETREEVLARLRQVVNDSAVDISFAPGPQAPATDPSPTMTPPYQAIRRAIGRLYPHDAEVVAFMSRGGSDSSYLRLRGMPVYGAPLFIREPGDNRVHGNDERIAAKSLDDGVELLWQIVLEIAGEN